MSFSQIRSCSALTINLRGAGGLIQWYFLLADSQKVVILRDAGRMEEARAAMNERNKQWNVDKKNAAEAEDAVTKAVEQLRDERQKRVGKGTCG